MILSNELTHSQIAKAAGCHPSTITRHVTNMNLFGDVNGREIDGTVCRPEAGTFLYLAAACGGIREVTRSEENNSMC
jgi:hypothetical protein